LIDVDGFGRGLAARLVAKERVRQRRGEPSQVSADDGVVACVLDPINVLFPRGEGVSGRQQQGEPERYQMHGSAIGFMPLSCPSNGKNRASGRI